MLSLNMAVRAVVADEGKILAGRHTPEEGKPFYQLLGGYVRAGQPQVPTLINVVKNEAGLQIEVEKFLYLVESFTLKSGKPVQEIAFYYLCKPKKQGLLANLLRPARVAVKPELLSAEQLAELPYWSSDFRELLVDDLREYFASCPRNIVINELEDSAAAKPGTFQL